MEITNADRIAWRDAEYRRLQGIAPKIEKQEIQNLTLNIQCHTFILIDEPSNN